jgi:hypothetical protein
LEIFTKKITIANFYWFAILIIGMALRIQGVTSNSLSLEELGYIQLANLPIKEFWSHIFIPNDLNPFFATGLFFWFLIFPETDLAGRVFPIAIDILNLVLINKIFSNILNPRMGLGIAFFYAVSAFSIFCSQQIEPHTVSLLITLLCFNYLNTTFNNNFSLHSYLITTTLLLIGLNLNSLFIFFLLAMVLANFFSLKSKPNISLRNLLLTILVFLIWIIFFDGSLALEKFKSQSNSFSITQILYLISRMILGYGVLPLTEGSSDLLMEIVMTNFTMIVFVAFVVLVALGLSTWNIIKSKTGGLPKFILPLIFPVFGFCLYTKDSNPFDERLLIIATPFFFAFLSYFPWPSFSQKNILLTVRPAIIGLFILGVYQHLLAPDFGKTPWRNAFKTIETQNEYCPNLVMANEMEVKLAKFYLGSAWPIYSLKDFSKLEKELDIKNPAVCPGFWTIESSFENQFSDNLFSKTNYVIQNEVRYPNGRGLKSTYYRLR